MCSLPFLSSAYIRFTVRTMTKCRFFIAMDDGNWAVRCTVNRTGFHRKGTTLVLLQLNVIKGRGYRREGRRVKGNKDKGRTYREGK